MDRNTAIKRIRAGLLRRTGKTWSVTGGRGTAYGWIHITAPPSRRIDATGRPSKTGYTSPAECTELGEALGLGHPVHFQGEAVPASSDYRREYVDRAEGRPPSVFGRPYWD